MPYKYSKDGKEYVGKDYLDGDFSFKKWFKIMFTNGYIPVFLITLSLAIISIFFKGVLDFEPENNSNWVVAGFCIFIMGVISYKGFYQFWKDLKNGNSR